MDAGSKAGRGHLEGGGGRGVTRLSRRCGAMRYAYWALRSTVPAPSVLMQVHLFVNAGRKCSEHTDNGNDDQANAKFDKRVTLKVTRRVRIGKHSKQSKTVDRGYPDHGDEKPDLHEK